MNFTFIWSVNSETLETKYGKLIRKICLRKEALARIQSGLQVKTIIRIVKKAVDLRK